MKFFDPKKKENEPVHTTPVQQPQPNRPQQPQSNRPQQPEIKPAAVPQSNPAPVQAPAPAPAQITPVPEPVVPPAAIIHQPVVPVQPAPQPEPKYAPAPVSKSAGKSVLGSSLIIRGEVTAEENLIIEGFVDGSIETGRDVLVGPEGKVHATIRATNVIIQGTVIGDVSATNKVDLTASGLLQGNIQTPRLTIADSALFKGTIDMRSADPSAFGTKEVKKEKPLPQSPETK